MYMYGVVEEFRRHI